MIREATKTDLAVALYWAERFHAAWPLRESVPFDTASMATTLMDLFEGDRGVVFLSDNGFIGALIYPMYLNSDYLIAQELFWFCDGNDEGLRSRFEEWAKGHGAKVAVMCYMADDHSRGMERLYRMNGYHNMESQVMKELN